MRRKKKNGKENEKESKDEEKQKEGEKDILSIFGIDDKEVIPSELHVKD